VLARQKRTRTNDGELPPDRGRSLPATSKALFAEGFHTPGDVENRLGDYSCSLASGGPTSR
jgi:hypothetical protein